MSDKLTLSEILGRSVALEWHEGVALVRGVIEYLGVETQVVPELRELAISPGGAISVLGGRPCDEPVRRFGQLLQATLGQADPPAQLRLVISQATAPTPLFGSVADFDQALGYYARPDRRAVLRDLYARAAVAPSPSDSTPTPTLDAIAPLSTSEKRDHAETRDIAAAKRRARQLVVAVALLVIAGAVGFRYARASGVAPAGADVEAIAQRASDAIGAFVRSTLSTVSERVGFGRLVWSETAAAESARSVPPPARDASEKPEAASPRQSAPQALASSSTQAAPVTPPIPATAPLLAFDLQPLPAAAAALNAGNYTSDPKSIDIGGDSVNEDAPGDSLTIYSPDATEVLPPVAIRPQLPRDLPPGIDREDLMSIELVVSSDGSVDSVKLLGRAQGVRDWVWLSAIKAWQFRPAVKDGRPVRYRKTVWIAYR